MIPARSYRSIAAATVAIAFLGIAPSRLTAELIKVEFAGTVNGNYLNANAFGGQINANDPYSFSFIMDTNVQVPSGTDGYGYRQFVQPATYTFKAGSFERTDGETLVVGFAPGSDGYADQFYLGFCNTTSISGDPLGSIYAGGNGQGMFSNPAAPTLSDLVSNASHLSSTGVATFAGVAPMWGGSGQLDFYTTNQTFTFTPVPEPTALGILSVGSLAMLARRRGTRQMGASAVQL